MAFIYMHLATANFRLLILLQLLHKAGYSILHFCHLYFTLTMFINQIAKGNRAFIIRNRNMLNKS